MDFYRDPLEACCLDGPLEGDWYPVLQSAGVTQLGPNKFPYELEQGESGEWYYLYVGEKSETPAPHADAAHAPPLIPNGTRVYLPNNGHHGVVVDTEMDVGVRVYTVLCDDGIPVHGVLSKEMQML